MRILIIKKKLHSLYLYCLLKLNFLTSEVSFCICLLFKRILFNILQLDSNTEGRQGGRQYWPAHLALCSTSFSCSSAHSLCSPSTSSCCAALWACSVCTRWRAFSSWTRASLSSPSSSVVSCTRSENKKMHSTSLQSTSVLWPEDNLNNYNLSFTVCLKNNSFSDFRSDDFADKVT